MKRRFLATIALVLVLSVALSGCAVLDFVKDFFQENFGEEIKLTDAPLNAEKVIDFANGDDQSVFTESDGWSNGDVFNVVWKKNNVRYENGLMYLGITEEKVNAWLNEQEVEFDYTAGEARSQNYYHYGDYKVSMKPSANPGTASTFFICTGPYDEKVVDGVKVPNPHDEIDIEFLGKDTTHVQFNFFVNGAGGNEFMYDLGFDASEEFHEYGFRWLPDSITWFVDGKPVYKVTTDKTATEGKNLRIVDALPQTAGKMLANYWCGNERAWGWMGKYDGNVKDNGSVYQWIATSAEGAPLNPPTDDPVTPPATDEINWADIAPIAPGFASADKYTVTIDGNKANVTYTDISGSAYKPIEMDVADAVAGKNYVYMKVTNNGTETVNVRLNMFDPTLTGNNQATNISATMNGVAVRTDLDWGGSFFDIPAGETAELVVAFGVGGTKLQLMIDSSRNDAVLRSGNITVEDIKFATLGEVVVPPAPCTHVDENGDGKCDSCQEDMPTPAPQDPVSGNLNLSIGDYTTTIGGNVTDGYGVNVDEDGKIQVTYTNIVGNSYKNFWADVSSIAGNKNIFSMKVTNNGTATVKVRIDIESKTQITANTIACNLSATQDGAGVFTDLEYGGSVFEIPAGVTATLEVVYDASKLPTNVKIMADSCTYQDTAVYAGNITIFDLAFSGEYIPEEGGDDNNNPDQGGDDNEAPAPEFTDLYVKFDGNTEYTLETPQEYWNGIRVTYSNMAPNWQNICAYVGDKSAGCTIYSAKITNNGTATVHVMIQVADKDGNKLIDKDVTVAAGATEDIYYEFEGTAELIYFFVDANPYVVAEVNSGDVTISELKFGKIPASAEPDPEPTPTPVIGEYVKFNGDPCYTITAEQEYWHTVQVTYTAVTDATYQNVNTWIQDKAAGKNTLGVTVKNNGTETVNITVKLENADKEANEYKMTIPAGETKTLSESYTIAPDSLYFFIDSGWVEPSTEATHAGDVTISGINFQ